MAHFFKKSLLPYNPPPIDAKFACESAQLILKNAKKTESFLLS